MTRARSLPVIESCWMQIGVRGDRSCPELASVIHCQNCQVFSAAARTLLDRPAREDALTEFAAFVAEPLEARQVADRSAVLFALAGEAFAIETDAVIEVGDASAPRRVPHRSNDVFAGLIHLKGRLELCISLAGALGLPQTRGPTDKRVRVLVAAAAGQRWVLPVDAIAGIQRFHHSQLVEVPASSQRANRFVVGLVPSDGRLYGLLDFARICEQVKERMR